MRIRSKSSGDAQRDGASPETPRSVTLTITACVDCPHHKVVSDPDPHDWFNDDDQKVVCAKADPNKTVASGIRPYNLRKEALIPTWCPLR